MCDIPLLESCFTKPECFNIMECETENIKFSNQIIATYFIIKVCDKSRRFVKEWLDYCCQEKLLSPAGLKKNETPTNYMGSNFVSHREDQSIFSLLCKNIRFSLIRIYLKEDMTLKVIDLHFMYIRNLYIIMIYTNL